MIDTKEIQKRYLDLLQRLIAEMNPEGYWAGRLSTSALSTAVAITALKLTDSEVDTNKIRNGLEWLYNNINKDGGYGDTPSSESNVSTTLLSYAAISFCQENNNGQRQLQAMEKWLAAEGINIDPVTITKTVLRFYGSDYTFSVPILSMLTICGVIPAEALNSIPALPYELALLPPSWYNAVNLRVVSYALPALIGVGIYLHRHRKKLFPGCGIFRNRFVAPAMRKLESIMPESGGFLEAPPLTGFVCMCLVKSDLGKSAVAVKGFEFLRIQQREDGGWPIDTDLSTWVTTLSIKALGEQLNEVLGERRLMRLREHLLRLQYHHKHPFNGAEPGGWGWTNNPGSVPDADDTPGVILALLSIYNGSIEELNAIEKGCLWLAGVQNRDGGFPTFCRGWGRLPFDRSCADLTGHAMLAMAKTVEILHDRIQPGLEAKISRSISMAMGFLTKQQADDGSWLPLWFGNQLTDDKSNPVYGTARVCAYLGDCLVMDRLDPDIIRHLGKMVLKARDFLIDQQNSDGSWGGRKGIDGSVEETALAISALTSAGYEPPDNALEWLGRQEVLKASPIGLYFAKLWYDERLYPLIFYTEALRRHLGY